MEEGYTQLGTVLTDQRPEDSEGDGVIVVGRFKGNPYDGVQLSHEAGGRNLYLTPEGRCAWHSCSQRQSKGISTSGRDPRAAAGSLLRYASLASSDGRPDLAPETQRGALSIALIPAVECLSESLGQRQVDSSRSSAGPCEHCVSRGPAGRVFFGRGGSTGARDQSGVPQ